ncbi:unnamed protein product [Linum trigynum]|uniref:Srp40 C-terminal domain-containing protein n=1 Tax=Linum trigynum TaxID=586398 RepID=A0AAV2CQA2_9ROSI
MPKKPARAIAGGEGLNINPTLLALKPRPVSLLFTSSSMSAKTPLVLNPDQRAILLHSLALFLQRSGYSKTLKKLRTEAKLQDQNDISEGSAFDIEEIFCKFLETSGQGCKKPESLSSKEEDLWTGHSSDKAGTFVFSASADTVNVRKKKKSAKNETDTAERASGASAEFYDSETVDKPKKSTNDLEGSTKAKQKSSKKLSSQPVSAKSESVSGGEQDPNSILDSATDSLEKRAKSKEKRQKKDSLASQKLSSANTEKIALMVNEIQGNESKKRKRLASEEDSAPPDDGNQVEERKRQRTEAAAHDLQAHVNTDEKEHKVTTQKSTKKLQNGSSEPTTAQRFQRVKAEEVVFSDERLKDNSYWAKDGAETGYGAKAQEVLGQVKGRGFRHEKTKKKRGSYRGGQIDIHSHSIKFNYSDED